MLKKQLLITKNVIETPGERIIDRFLNTHKMSATITGTFLLLCHKYKMFFFKFAKITHQF